MDDLISRQAAIDALDNADWYHQDRNKDMVLGANPPEHQAWYKEGDIYKAIENVPSEQPKQRWIPCSERLPREYTRVIGYMAWKAITAIEYQHGRWYSIDHLEPLPDEAVSHWMPLPKPPKGE